MLTLTRKAGQAICIGVDIKIVVREIRGGQVRISIDAPLDVRVDREEVSARLKLEQARDRL